MIARSDDDENDEDKDARGNVLGLIVLSDEETEDPKDSCHSAVLNAQRLHDGHMADDDDMDDDEDDDDDTDSDLHSCGCGHPGR